jgi:guanylate kinase
MNPSLIAEHLLIIAGPSGVGKSTLIRSLLSQSPSLRLSVSYTTRSPRAGEFHGVDYHFTDRASFERMRDDSAFVEWAEVHGNLYGTTRATIEDTIRRGDDLLFDVDIQGTSSLKAAFPDAWAVLISPPDPHRPARPPRLSRHRLPRRHRPPPRPRPLGALPDRPL